MAISTFFTSLGFSYTILTRQVLSLHPNPMIIDFNFALFASLYHYFDMYCVQELNDKPVPFWVNWEQIMV
jgi:hypothetical protein